jgi:F-type H+-transporting ATPase subunit a
MTLSILNTLVLASSDPVAHVVDTQWFGWKFSSVSFMLVLTGLITVVIMSIAAKSITTGRGTTIDDFRAKGIWANMIEATNLYLRNDVFRPVLGKDTDRFTPILWTFFWFILIANLLGLVPLKDATALLGINKHPDPLTGQMVAHGIGGTATQSIWVTASLSLIAFLLINVTAIARDPVGYVKHMTAGAPVLMWPIMIPVEILGTFVKPFALTMRLFANMTGGHIVIAVMLGFVYALVDALGPAGNAVAIIPLGAAIAIYFLEILVAFIQAFVFTFLTCLFLGQLIAHHGDHGDEHGHGHEGHGGGVVHGHRAIVV